MDDLTYAQVASLIKCDPATGKLVWLERKPLPTQSPARVAAWNDRYAGKEAFTSTNSGGYRSGRILGRDFRAHQVVWMMAYREWPDGEVDHINGDRSDNRLDNIRLVDRSTNMRNIRRPKTNTSGAIGVSWNKVAQKWEAHIQISGRKKHLGLFGSVAEARSARLLASKRYGFHDNHGRA